VLDFGLAKVTERELRPGSIMLTQEGMVFGTPEFMSPEQAQGKVLDARSDVYSLAVILYEVLTGKLPFDAKTPMEYIQAHVTKPPISLDDRIPGKRFHDGLASVLNRAMAKSADDRFPSAAEFAQALKPFAGLQGKGYTAWMPKGTAESLAQNYAYNEAVAATQGQVGGAAPAGGVDLPVPDLPVVPIEPSKPSVPIRAPSPTAKAIPAAMNATGAAQGSQIPAPSVLAPQPIINQPPLPVLKKRPQPSPATLIGVAAGCLVVGILITAVFLRIFG
jgi:serine/threonine protein kinase